MLDKTVKKVHSVDAAIPNNDKLHNTITGKLQQYTDVKQGLTSIWQLSTVCVVPTAIITKVIIQTKLRESLTLLILLPDLYILMQKTATLNARRLVKLLPADI